MVFSSNRYHKRLHGPMADAHNYTSMYFVSLFGQKVTQCYDMGHSGRGINLHGVLMILMGKNMYMHVISGP